LLQGVLQRPVATPHAAVDDRKAVRRRSQWRRGEGPRRERVGAARRSLTSPPIGRSHTHRIRVRYGECDPQGVVFNAHYFAYFDVVLTEAWREAIGPYNDMIEEHGTDLVVAEASARFLGPARFDDLIDVEWRITRLGTTAM